MCVSSNSFVSTNNDTDMGNFPEDKRLHKGCTYPRRSRRTCCQAMHMGWWCWQHFFLSWSSGYTFFKRYRLVVLYKTNRYNMNDYAENPYMCCSIPGEKWWCGMTEEGKWRHRSGPTSIQVIDSGNSLLHDGANPLPEPMLTYHQRCSVAFIWEQYHANSNRDTCSGI